MEGRNSIIHLTDSEGNDCQFEFLDLIEYDGKDYVILLPLGDDEVLILKVEDSENSEHESYAGVEDEGVLKKVFEIFRERFKDEFNFYE